MNEWQPPAPHRRKSTLARDIAIVLAICIAVIGLYVLAVGVLLSSALKGSNK